MVKCIDIMHFVVGDIIVDAKVDQMVQDIV
jgi:hypothetical protein